jgi:4-aminobutyrate aminotransferase-like enzyme
MTMAKGIANGFPLANVVTRPEIASSMVEAGLTISTFGGNPVSTAASFATIEVLEKEANPLHVKEMGDHLRAGLDATRAKYPLIGEVRGKGLMQGIELVADQKTREPAPNAASLLLEETRSRGMLIGKGGFYGNVIRIAPPLIVTEVDIDRALEMLDDAMTQVHDSMLG